MADKHTSPTAMPLASTLEGPAGPPQSLASLPPTNPTTSTDTPLPPSTSISSSMETPQSSDANNRCNTLAPITSPMAMGSKKPLDINSLMSPPEPTPYDSFRQSQSSPPATTSKTAMTTATAMHQAKAPRPQAPMSPPVSPFNKPESNTAALVAASTIKDPILYPSQDATPSPPARPLFEQFAETAADSGRWRVVDEHMSARSPTMFQTSSPPQREDYELALHFKAQVMDRYLRDPRSWLEKERRLLMEDRKAGAKAGKRGRAKFPMLLPARPTGTGGVLSHASTGHQAQAAKAQRGPRTDKVSKPTYSSPRPIRTHPPPQRAAARVSATPEPRRTVAPNREDKDFNALPDYCPPSSSLPSKPNCLKVDWKGAPIDLSEDPNARLLHPDEVSLAANLRLDCATYLTSKRRIFIRRVECARVGKEFRKTDAQQACKIDVNKASKLWTAFDKVGWLDVAWVRPYLLGDGSAEDARVKAR